MIGTVVCCLLCALQVCGKRAQEKSILEQLVTNKADDIIHDARSVSSAGGTAVPSARQPLVMLPLGATHHTAAWQAPVLSPKLNHHGRLFSRARGDVSMTSASASNKLLGSWLAEEGLLRFEEPRAVGFENLLLADGPQGDTSLAVVALRDYKKGDTIFDLRADACLTPSAVYADKEIGSELSRLAAAIGPGFDIIALATFLAIERVRGFLEPSTGRMDRLGAVPGLSPWSPLTSALWATEQAQPSTIDPSLADIVEQGVALTLPIVERVARRAWTQKNIFKKSQPGTPDDPNPKVFSAAWIQAAITDDGEGFSGAELTGFLRQGFAMAMARRWPQPPGYFECDVQPCDVQPERWGWADSAPEGPALLPPFSGVLANTLTVPSEAEDVSAMKNAIVGVPPPPSSGNLGEGVCLRCVASRDIAVGETILVGLDPYEESRVM